MDRQGLTGTRAGANGRSGEVSAPRRKRSESARNQARTRTVAPVTVSYTRWPRVGAAKIRNARQRTEIFRSRVSPIPRCFPGTGGPDEGPNSGDGVAFRASMIVPAPNVATYSEFRSTRASGRGRGRGQPSTVDSCVSEPKAIVCKAPRTPQSPWRCRPPEPAVQVRLGQRAASAASTLVRDCRSPRRSGAKHAHCADREASQSRTVEIARVKSACGRRAMTSHLNAW